MTAAAVQFQYPASVAESLVQLPVLDYDFLQVEYEAVENCILNLNYDFWTIISGQPGFGKSTLALLLATITGRQRHFSPKTNMAYDTETFIEHLVDNENGSTEIFDEAVQGASGKESMHLENRNLEAVAEIVRGLNHHAIMCIPRFWGYSPYWRNFRADTWIHIERRGRCLVHVPSRNLYDKDDVFWEPVVHVEYDDLDGTELYREYQEAKNAYIRPAIRSRLAEIRAKKDKATGNGGPGDKNDGPDLWAVASEVKANPETFRKARGWNVARIEHRFKIKPGEARRVAAYASELNNG